MKVSQNEHNFGVVTEKLLDPCRLQFYLRVVFKDKIEGYDHYVLT